MFERFNIAKILNRRFLLFEEEYFFFKIWNYLRTQKIAGDYLEFGVYEGKTFIKSATNAIKHHFPETKFFAFDSFQGLPDTGDDPIFHKGQFKGERRPFERKLAEKNIDPNRVQIVEGWYNDTLTEATKRLHNQKAALIMIDCDLYSSTKTCLEYITDLLQEGTVIIFDDWYAYKANEDKGEQRALKEWLEKNPNIKVKPYLNFQITGMSFIIGGDAVKPPACNVTLPASTPCPSA